jgi:protein ImuB
MNPALYACVHVAEFPLQALLRLRTELRSSPVAVLDGEPPHQSVCSINRAARMSGVALGMTKLEAETIPALRLVPRLLETEAAAHAVLLECAARFSPRIEAEHSSNTTTACVLDITGTERLFGPPDKLAARLRASLAAAGFRASIAVSANFHAARLKAASIAGVAVIASGEEAAALSRLPLSTLRIDSDDEETFAIWGIRTLGELAALPQVDLVTRLGARALEFHALARGALPHTFQPIEPKFTLEEFCDFETPVEQADALLFVTARGIDCLVSRASARALSLASLTLRMGLEVDRVPGRVSERIHERVIRPALPTVDRKFLLKLVQLDLAANPPQAAVLSLTIAAQAGHSSKVQLGLFAPQMPEPSRLDVTLARLKAIAGEDRVGSPVLEDSHRPAAFRMDAFTTGEKSDEASAASPRLALRRLRPSVPVRVALHELKPISFRDRDRSFAVEAAYGPWKTSGNWWSEATWESEEWDVLAVAGDASLACLLVRDCARNQWRLEALYD